MIPLYLSLEGVYSYRQKEEIDFERLASNRLFGIFGKVGSGKSSILEAITLALYGNIERLNNVNLHLNIMNLQCPSYEIEFRWRQGEDVYKVTAMAKRKKSDPTQLAKSERKYYKQIGDAWQPLSSEELAAVLILDYDEFKKIVIIPQGHFAEFVTLPKADRTKMMTKLFNLERFDLADKVKILCSSNNSNIDQLSGQLIQLQEYKVEEIAAEQAKAKLLEKERIELEAKILRLQKILSAAEVLQKASSELSKVQQELDRLKLQASVIEQLKKEKQQYETVQIKYASKLTSLAEKTLQYENALAMVTIQKQNLAAKEILQSATKTAIAALLQSFSTPEKQKKYAESINRRLELSDIERAIIDFQQKIIAHSASLKKVKATQEANKKELAEKRTFRQELQRNLSKTKQLYIQKQNRTDAARLLLESADLDKIQEQQLAEQRILETERLKQIAWLRENDLIRNLSENAPRAVVLETARNVQDYKNEQKTDVLNQLATLQNRASLHHYAIHLAEGEACPLCGSQEHPAPADEAVIAEEQGLWQAKLKSVEEILAQLARLVDRVELRINESVFLENKTLETQIAKAKLASAISENEIEWTGESMESIQTALDAAAEQQKTLNSLEKTIAELEKEAEQDSSAAIKEQINTLQQQISSSETEAKFLEKDACGKEEIALLEHPKTHAVQLISDAISAERELERLMILDREVAELSWSKSQAEKIAEELSLSKAILIENIKRSAKGDGFEGISAIKAILQKDLDLEKLAREIIAFEQEISTATNKEKELITQVGEGKYDEVVHNHRKAEMQIAANAKELITGNIAVNAANILQQEQKLKEKLAAELLMKSLKEREMNLKTLTKLFEARGFVNYISQKFLQQLFALANLRFKKLTNNTLELTIVNDEFAVKDYLNSGLTRILRTLSGGQLFQASLCLALALSEQIQQRHKMAQQFFFLDEGFGSLDKESLAMVFETLKDLSKKQRTVGVISHVEELQSEIEYHLNVSRSDKEGSKIAHHY